MRFANCITFVLTSLVSAVSFAQSITSKIPFVLNGPVNAVVADESNLRVYLGGNFTQAGRYLPNLTYLDATGQPTGNIPPFNGTIYTAVPDGSGGFYVSGNFTEVGAEKRFGLAQLDATGALTPWAKDTHFDAEITSLLAAPGKVYVGGGFSGTLYDGSTVLFDAASESALSTFAGLITSGEISSAASDDAGGWYVAGNFTEIGGLPRSGLAHVLSNGSVDNFFAGHTLYGSVDRLFRSGNTLYAAGPIQRFDPVWTACAAINTSGSLLPDFPTVQGEIRAVVPDGAGGWYIGGGFQSIGGVPRTGLAHILSDGTVAPWDPSVSGWISTMAYAGGIVYVGGYFEAIGGQARLHLAAIDGATGVLTAWDPAPDAEVHKLKISGSTVYVSGKFTQVGGAGRNSIAAVDITTGLATPWAPDIGGFAEAIEVSGGQVYLGGSFSSVNGTARNGLASVDATTAVLSSWDPSILSGNPSCIKATGSQVYVGGYRLTPPVGDQSGFLAFDKTTGAAGSTLIAIDNQVFDIEVSGGIIYAVGDFTQAGGQFRSGLAAFQESNSQLTSWNPGAIGYPRAVAAQGSTIVAGGNVQAFGGMERRGLAAFDLTTGQLTGWNPGTSGFVRGMATDGGTLYIGGFFSEVGGQNRNSLAAIDMVTGSVLPWNPNPDSQTILSLAATGGTVYVGGFFSTIGGQARNGLAALDGATGSALSWNPNVTNGTVNAILLKGTTILAAGSFTQVGGQSRGYLAEIDLSSGALTGWNPNPNGTVENIAVIGNTIYAAGNFTFIGSQFRNRLASLDDATGSALSWNPSPNGGVNVLMADANNVLASGYFSSVFSQARKYLAALDQATGQLTPWSPLPDAPVTWLGLSGSTLYTAGYYTTIGGQPRNFLGAVDVNSGLATAWNPSPDGDVYSCALTGSALYVAGAFTTVGGQARNWLAAVDLVNGSATSWNPDPDNEVARLTTSGNLLVVAGNFSSIAGAPQNFIAQFDITSGALTSWEPAFDRDITWCTASGSTLYVAGNFEFVNGTELPKYDPDNFQGSVCAVDMITGQLLSWQPLFDGFVQKIVPGSSAILVTGDFRAVGVPTALKGLAAVDALTGELLPWSPQVVGTVNELLVRNGQVYAGGSFTSVGGLARNNLALLDGDTGAVQPWNPGSNGTINDMLLNGSDLVVTGEFTTLAGVSRSYLGSINAAGTATAWNPVLNNFGNAVFLGNDHIYVAGNFNQVNGNARKRFAAFDAASGALLSHDLSVDPGSVLAFAATENRIFGGAQVGVGVGDANGNLTNFLSSSNRTVNKLYYVPDPERIIAVGEFSSLAGQHAAGVATIDDYDLSIGDWGAEASGVNALALLLDRAFVGGSFTEIGGIPQSYFSVIQAPFTAKILQTISTDPIGLKVIGDPAFNMNAVSSSGLPLSFSSSDETVATVVNGVVTLHTVGTCIITISQPGDGSHTAASIQRTITVLNAEPASPTAMVFSAVSATGFTVSWTPPAPAPTGYLVVRKQGASPAGGPADGTVYSPGDPVADGVAAFIGTSVSFPETSLSTGLTYHYAVYAYNGAGPVINYNGPLANAHQTAPVAPVLNAATNVGQLTFDLTWSSVFSATDYRIDVSMNNFSTLVPGLQDLSLGNGTSALVTVPAAGTPYQFRLTAINGGGRSIPSNTQSALMRPPTPVALDGSGSTTSSFVAHWQSALSATAYFLDVAADVNFATMVFPNVAVGNVTSFQVNGLASGSNYFYRVRAENGTGLTPSSNPIAISTVNPINLLTLQTPASVATEGPGFATKTIRAEISGGTGTRTVTLKYRGILAGAFQFKTMDPLAADPDQFETTVPESAMDEMGIEYSFEANDGTNSPVESSEPSFIYWSATSADRVKIPFAPGFTGSKSTYQMFSIPYELASKTVSDIFDAALGTYDRTQWRLFHYQGGQYKEYTEGFTTLALGYGYWFNTTIPDKEFILGDHGVIQRNQYTSFSITLEPGWNQIGNPYPFNVDWDLIKADNPLPGLNSLWLYENGVPVKKTVLPRWKGGFVFSDNGGPVIFRVSAKTNLSGRVAATPGITPDEPAWILPIQLSDGAVTSQAGVGMHPDASGSKDRFDEIVMPRFLDFVEMTTYHKEFFAPRFAVDVVGPSTNQEWVFTLTSSTGAPLTLTWDNSALASSRAAFLLVDLTLGTWMDMKTSASYRVAVAEGHTIKIVFGKEGKLLPAVTLLGAAYPNPFQDLLTIPVLAGQDNEEIGIEILDLSGRRVRRLTTWLDQAGPGTIAWDGKDDSGADVPAGMFLYRLSTGRSGSWLTRKIIKY